MAYPAITYTFVNDTTADATQVNQNFTDLVNGISDGTKDLKVNKATVSNMGTSGATGITLRTNDTTRVFIAQSGNVGFGTAVPDHVIHVLRTGQAKILIDSDDSELSLKDNASGKTWNLVMDTNGRVRFDNGTYSPIHVLDNGRVGISNGAPAHALDVTGAINASVCYFFPIYTVASLPTAYTGAMVYVSNEAGGAIMAFGDGTDWRRVTDRTVVS